MNKKPEDKKLSFDGPEGQSLFWKINNEFFDKDMVDSLINKYYRLSQDLPGKEHERLMALEGAMLVENALSEFLIACSPGFEALHKRGELTFFQKIRVGRALQYCPSKIMDSADCIRKIRNEFAHNIKEHSFSILNKKLHNAMDSNLLHFIGKAEYNNLQDKYLTLVRFTCGALISYRSHVIIHRQFTMRPEYVDELLSYHKSNSISQ